MQKRSDFKRYAAPVVFLAGLTVAVLLIRSGLDSGAVATTTGAALPTVSASTTTSTGKKHAKGPAKTTTATAAAKQFYTVQSGDTYGTIASKYGIGVTQLEALNPGVSSTSLSIGEHIRVK